LKIMFSVTSKFSSDLQVQVELLEIVVFSFISEQTGRTVFWKQSGT